MTFEEARAQFPVLDRFAYLNAGTFGPMARTVADAVAAEQRRALEEGRINRAAFERFIEQRPLVRGKFADVLGVPPENVALTTSTTESCNVVLNGLDLQEGDEIVTTDSEHFGLIGPVAASRATVRVARIRDRPADEAFDAILAEVGSNTKLLALSDVTWILGHRLPWLELRQGTGVPVLVDGAQSVGAVPIDIAEADFYTVSGQKWLCGPDLTGALYVRVPERLRVAQPSYLSQQKYDLAVGHVRAARGGGPLRHALHAARNDRGSPRDVRRASRVALRASRRDRRTLPGAPCRARATSSPSRATRRSSRFAPTSRRRRSQGLRSEA